MLRSTSNVFLGLMALSLIAAPLLPAAEAQAAVIVSNESVVGEFQGVSPGEARAGRFGGASTHLANGQQFTTGSQAGGYVLNSVELYFSTRSGNPAPLVVVVTAATSTNTAIPDFASSAVLATLSGPSSPNVKGWVTFTAPADTVTLQPSSNYFIAYHADGSSNSGRDGHWYEFWSHNGDAESSRDGWTIANTRSYRNAGTNWNSGGAPNDSIIMRVSVDADFPSGTTIPDPGTLNWGLPFTRTLPAAEPPVSINYSLTRQLPAGLQLNNAHPPTITGAPIPAAAVAPALYGLEGRGQPNTNIGPLTFELGVSPPFASSGNFPGGVVGDLTFTQGVERPLTFPSYGGTLGGSPSYAITGRALPAGMGFGGGPPQTRGSTPDLSGTPSAFQRQTGYNYEIELGVTGATNPTQQFTITVLPAPPTAAIAAISGANAIRPGALVELDATASTGGYTLAYAWTQSAADTVSVQLAGANTNKASFIAPVQTTPATLRFGVQVTDDQQGGRTATDTVTVHVLQSAALQMAEDEEAAARQALADAQTVLQMTQEELDTVQMQRDGILAEADAITLQINAVNAQYETLLNQPPPDVDALVRTSLATEIVHCLDVNRDGRFDGDDMIAFYYARGGDPGVTLNSEAERRTLLTGLHGGTPSDADLQALIARARDFPPGASAPLCTPMDAGGSGSGTSAGAPAGAGEQVIADAGAEDSVGGGAGDFGGGAPAAPSS